MTSSEKGALIVQSARGWIGTPYLHQASLKGGGCDCLGLIRGVWRDLIGEEPVSVPSYSSAWAEISHQETLIESMGEYFQRIALSEICSGDVVVFRMKYSSIAKHLGIMATQKTFIHAYDGNHVVESAFSEFWFRRVAAVFRFPIFPIEDNG